METQPDPRGWEAPPAVLSLNDGEVHLWLVDLAREGNSGLSADEAARAARLRFPKDRARFVARRSALRRLLGGYAGVAPDQVIFAYGEHGKPRVASPSEATDLEFSLADSGPLCVYAIAHRRVVGVDLEWLRPDVDVGRVAERVLPEPERTALAALPPHERMLAFFTRWVAEEAALKLSGTGIAGFDDPLAAHRGASILPFPVPPGYAAALATEAPCPAPRRWRLA